LTTLRTVALLSLLLVTAAAAPRGPAPAAQATQPPPPRFRTGVDVVEVAVLVKDRDGKPVTDLASNEITVLENRAPQTVVAFERVSVPPRSTVSPARAPQVPEDVASNEGIAPARVFVLVLDSHHVAGTRVRAVQTLARQFIENYVGPGDYAAVFSPGALPSATQDFTTDKARLLAAIDQFTGMKMMSAVVEVEREKAAVDPSVRGAVPMHGGHDPSDSERTDRAVALAGTLEALANHLERISGRRKTLLLFSEGVDYDQADVLGKVQRNANDVMRGMGRAIGALMRTNVALYAVDPRGLNSPDADLLETPLYTPGGVTTRTLADEQNDSIRALHSLSESTGGFAAVNRNDFAGAFERIDLESRSYYVIGYSPELPAKPGEFRSIEVKVSRPDVRISARSGYAGKTAAAVRRTIGDSPPSEPASGFPMPPTRGRGRAPEPVNVSAPAPATTRGLPSQLQELLASPLPQPGLPMRVQAVTMRADGRKSDVRLVVEVLGQSLRFEERGGRFNERLELALMTVNDSGRGSNGTSIGIDLRLTPEDLVRVRGTGVRWLSALALPPGRHQLRVAGRANGTGVSGLITQDIVVPDTRRGLDMSAVTITSVPSVLMITRGKAWLERALPTPPTAARTFVGGDQLVAAVELYRPEKGASDGTLRVQIDRADGSPSGLTERRPVQAAGPRTEEIGIPIDTAKMPAGRYVLRMTLEVPGSERLERAVPFQVVRK
jgi:VWFA-related protein